MICQTNYKSCDKNHFGKFLNGIVFFNWLTGWINGKKKVFWNHRNHNHKWLRARHQLASVQQEKKNWTRHAYSFKRQHWIDSMFDEKNKRKFVLETICHVRILLDRVVHLIDFVLKIHNFKRFYLFDLNMVEWWWCFENETVFYGSMVLEIELTCTSPINVNI